MDPRVIRESLVRTRSERVLDRYIRGVEPVPVKKPKTEALRHGEVTAAEAACKLVRYMSDERKYEKSLGLLRRLVEEKGQELPIDLLISVLTAVASSPLLHYQGREDSTRLFTLMSDRVKNSTDQMALWTLLFTKVNNIFTDDSLVFSSRGNELLSYLETAALEEQSKEWWERVAAAVEAISKLVQRQWARVPVAKLIDFCVRHIDKFEERCQGKVTELATNSARERLLTDSASRNEVSIRAPLDSGHSVVDGREEVSTINSSEAWSTKQSGLSK